MDAAQVRRPTVRLGAKVDREVRAPDAVLGARAVREASSPQELEPRVLLQQAEPVAAQPEPSRGVRRQVGREPVSQEPLARLGAQLPVLVAPDVRERD